MFTGYWLLRKVARSMTFAVISTLYFKVEYIFYVSVRIKHVIEL